MQNGIPVGLRSSPSFGLSRSGQLTAIIQSLFWDGSQGWWYDDDDLTTLFQDSAGTTPVTAVEQFVGLQLDKSRGLVLGPELVTNGDFSAGTTGWAYTGSGSFAAVGGRGVLTLPNPVANRNDRQVYFTLSSLTAGKWYLVSANVELSAGVTRAHVSLSTNVADSDTTEPYVLFTSSGTKTFIASATGATMYLRAMATTYSNGGVFSIDNISVRELPGNHRYAPASGNRPIWSKRVNLLTKTEQFDDAAWVKSNATVTANATTAPDGTLTADKLIAAATTSSHYLRRDTTFATQAVFSIYAKAAEESVFFIGNATGSSGCLFNLSLVTVTPVVGSTGTITPVGNGWYRCEVTRSEWLDWQYISLRGNQTSYTGDGTSGLFIWGADLRPANQATGLLPLYQRVNTSTDYDTNGFPGYLKADGVDDFLQTNSINFTATDKITLCAGVRKLSDAATGLLTELGTDSATFNGSFSIFAPSMTGANSYRFISRGTTTVTVGTGVFAAAPITNVVTGVGEISTDTCILRVNGAEVATNTADQGTGNYGNYVTYFFRRSGATSPFNGYEYGNVAVGKLLTADQLTALETYMNGLTKAY